MKKGYVIIVSMLLAFSMMASACTVVKTKKADEDNKETTEAAGDQDDTKKADENETAATAGSEDTEKTKAADESGAVSDETAEITAAATEATTSEASTTAAPVPQGDCKLLFDIDYDENIALAKYSVNLYLDGEKIDTIEHGQYYLHAVDTTTGDHEIKLEKRGDDSIATSMKITLSGDSTVILAIKSHLDEIEIQNVRLADTLMETDVEMPDVTELRLDKAIEALEAAGFKNIETESDKIIIIKSNWVVISQNVAAGEKVNRATKIIITCEKDG